MGLKAFHLLFIALSIVLSIVVAGWSVQQYQANHAPMDALTGLVGVASAAGLAVYAAAFRRKARRL